MNHKESKMSVSLVASHRMLVCRESVRRILQLLLQDSRQNELSIVHLCTKRQDIGKQNSLDAQVKPQTLLYSETSE